MQYNDEEALSLACNNGHLGTARALLAAVVKQRVTDKAQAVALCARHVAEVSILIVVFATQYKWFCFERRQMPNCYKLTSFVVRGSHLLEAHILHTSFVVEGAHFAYKILPM